MIAMCGVEKTQGSTNSRGLAAALGHMARHAKACMPNVLFSRYIFQFSYGFTSLPPLTLPLQPFAPHAHQKTEARHVRRQQREIKLAPSR